MTHEPSKWLPRFKLGLEVAILLIKMKRDVASSIAYVIYTSQEWCTVFFLVCLTSKRFFPFLSWTWVKIKDLI